MIFEDFNNSDLFGVTGRRTLKQFIADNKVSAVERFRVRSSLDEIDQLNQRLEELESIIAIFITSRPDKLEALDQLMSITGISLVVGAGLIA